MVENDYEAMFPIVRSRSIQLALKTKEHCWRFCTRISHLIPSTSRHGLHRQYHDKRHCESRAISHTSLSSIMETSGIVRRRTCRLRSSRSMCYTNAQMTLKNELVCGMAILPNIWSISGLLGVDQVANKFVRAHSSEIHQVCSLIAIMVSGLRRGLRRLYRDLTVVKTRTAKFDFVAKRCLWTQLSMCAGTKQLQILSLHLGSIGGERTPDQYQHVLTTLAGIVRPSECNI